jgi:hypothetical protein
MHSKTMDFGSIFHIYYLVGGDMGFDYAHNVKFFGILMSINPALRFDTPGGDIGPKDIDSILSKIIIVDIDFDILILGYGLANGSGISESNRLAFHKGFISPNFNLVVKRHDAVRTCWGSGNNGYARVVNVSSSNTGGEIVDANINFILRLLHIGSGRNYGLARAPEEANLLHGTSDFPNPFICYCAIGNSKEELQGRSTNNIGIHNKLGTLIEQGGSMRLGVIVVVLLMQPGSYTGNNMVKGKEPTLSIHSRFRLTEACNKA